MTVGSLFSGIGGFDLGFERAGFDIKWQVEIDDYANHVLATHWPGVKRYRDVKETHGPLGHAAQLQLRHKPSSGVDDVGLSGARTVSRQGTLSRCDACLEPVDVICGGFPCQPHSLAGARGGASDERDLWPEFARLIRELRPRWVVAENVPGLLSSDAGRFFGTVLGDLAAAGYDAEWDCISAADVGAPHLRERIWIVAYPHANSSGSLFGARDGESEEGLDFASGYDAVGLRADVADAASGTRLRSAQRPARHTALSGENMAHAERERSQGQSWGTVDGERWAPSVFTGLSQSIGRQWEFEPHVGRVAHGVSARVDRLRGLGNAIVPQIAQWIAERIQAAEMTAKQSERL